MTVERMASRRSGAAGVAWERVRLLDADPDFVPGLSDGARARAHVVVVPALRAERGDWVPPEKLGTAIAVVALDGFLIATGEMYGRPDMQLVGPGDVLDGRLLADRDLAWRTLEPVRLAVLDQGFMVAAAHWPALLAGLARRLVEGRQEQHTRTAICTLPRVEERILALLSHLAMRWGHVTPAGLTLALPMTHEMLGALIGARRPTVSLALLALGEQGLVSRRDDGAWLLPLECGDWPATGIPEFRRSIVA